MNGMDIDIWMSFLRVFAVLLALAPAIYFTTRWYAGRQLTGRSVTIRETIPLGTGRALYVIEWEGNQYFLAFTNQTIQLLDTRPVPDEEERH